MNVGFFVDLFYPYMLGGIEQRCFELAKRLIMYGDEVTVFSSSLIGIDSKEKLFDGKLNIIRTGFIKNPLSYRRKSSLFGFTLSSLKFKDYLREFDIVDFNQLCSLTGKIIAEFSHIPHVLTIHDLGPVRLFRPHSFILKMMTALHKKNVVITVSSAVKNKIVKYLKMNPDQIVVIPNGIDFNVINDLAKNIEKTHFKQIFNMVYVGRLVKYKNVDHIFYAIKNLTLKGYRINLNVIGMGEELLSLIQLSHTLGINKQVHFLGFLPDKLKVYEYMSKADLVVIPSMHEGFGITLLESMAARTPIVAYDLDAYHDFIINRHNGLLVEPGNIKKLTEAIRKVIDEPNISSELVNNGTKVAEKYDISFIVRSIRNVYMDVIQDWS